MNLFRIFGTVPTIFRESSGSSVDVTLLGNENFSALELDDGAPDANGKTLRDWHAEVLSAGTNGIYDTDFNAPSLRPAARQGQMYIASLLIGLRLFKDLRLLDEAVRLTELWYSHLSTDGSGYLYMPDPTYDQALDTNLEFGVWGRVMYAAHVNRALTSPAGHDYGTIADKYQAYLRDHHLPRWRGIEGTRFANNILPDAAGFRHDYAAVITGFYGLVEMGGGGGFTLTAWQDELSKAIDYYFALDETCGAGDGGRTTLVMPFTLYPPSAEVGGADFKAASGSLIYTTYVRYMITFLMDLYLEGVASSYLTSTWLTNLSHSLADFVLDTTFESNSLARSIGGDLPPNDLRCGVAYNHNYRPRVSSADDRWQDSGFAFLESFDSRDRIKDFGVQAYASSGDAGNYPIYAAARSYAMLIQEEPPVDPGPTQTQSFTEDTSTDFANPERGWYVESSLGNVGSQTNSTPVSTVAPSPTLELMFIRLDDYKRANLPGSFLSSVAGWLSQVRSSGRKVALRFGYNRPNRTEANNISAYPDANSDTSLSWMQTHVNQITNYGGASPIGVNLLTEYQDVIAVLQGGFIGRWGEQDSSAYNSDSPGKSQSGRNAFFAHLMARTPSTMMVQWRDPSYYQMDPANYPTPLAVSNRFTGSEQARVGHYNDCYLAGYEMTTYWDGNNFYSTEEQFQYTYDTGPYVAMGGETCNAYGLNSYNDADYSIAMMSNQAWDYLNSAYYRSMYQKWLDSGDLREISRRLGYRLALTSVTTPATVVRGGSYDITFTMKNAGFGKVYNKRPIQLVLTGPETSTITLTSDARRDLPLGGDTETVTYNFTVPSVTPGSYDLHLALPDPSSSLASDSRYAIRLANQGVSWSSGRNSLGMSLTVE